MKKMTTDSNWKLKNRFSPLIDMEEGTNDSEMEIEEGNTEESRGQEVKKKKPLSLVLHGNITNHKMFVDIMKQSVEDKFYLKYYEILRRKRGSLSI